MTACNAAVFACLRSSMKAFATAFAIGTGRSGSSAVTVSVIVPAVESVDVASVDAIDAGDLDGMAALFEHATFRSVGADGGISVLTGADEVRAGFAGSVQLHDGVPATQHVTTNLIVDEGPDGTTAT